MVISVKLDVPLPTASPLPALSEMVSEVNVPFPTILIPLPLFPEIVHPSTVDVPLPEEMPRPPLLLDVQLENVPALPL